MNPSPKRAFLDTTPTPTEEAVESPSAQDSPFGPSDHGTLRPDTRRVLVQLVRGPYVMRERHPGLWSALEADESAVRQGLGNLFLELVLDKESGLAFARNLSTEEDVPKVIRSTPLTLIDTALLLFLRDKLLRGESARVFVGRDEIDDQLGVYGSATDTDPVGLSKKITTSVNKMKDNSVLLRTEEEGRFEVSPILRMVFDAEQVTAVAQELRQLLDTGDSIPQDTDTEEDEEGEDQ